MRDCVGRNSEITNESQLKIVGGGVGAAVVGTRVGMGVCLLHVTVALNASHDCFAPNAFGTCVQDRLSPTIHFLFDAIPSGVLAWSRTNMNP